MAGKNGVHEASASATGYLYQCRIALLVGIRAIPTSPNLSISIEKFDDVAFDQDGTPAEMIQTKHHLAKTGNLTDASSDLWKTLLIWTKTVMADVEVPFKRKFILMTTGAAPADSAAYYLRAKNGERDEEKADAKAKKTDADKPPTVKLNPDAETEPLMMALNIASMELRAGLLLGQGKSADAKKLYAQAVTAEKKLGYREPPFYIRPVAETEAEALMRARDY